MTPEQPGLGRLGLSEAPRRFTAAMRAEREPILRAVRAFARGLPSGAAVVAGADALPLSDASFDGVLLTQVLEHVPEPWRLEHLARRAGFAEIEIAARGDSFTTIAQLMRNVAFQIGAAPDMLDGERQAARDTLVELAAKVERFATLDVDRVLPLGYQLTARRPATG
jgi:hypothetical protein